jgi:hypothetical protein
MPRPSPRAAPVTSARPLTGPAPRSRDRS